LGNRKAISKPAPKYTCNEEGKVVVEVSVDRNGKTISAIAGIKGTTNTAKCLLDQAKLAAMNTKWDASSDAPEKQVGKIVYNFNLN
jgi:outer membrane biosynthesis protein TonB